MDIKKNIGNASDTNTDGKSKVLIPEHAHASFRSET